jgi:hypothetical protein
VSAPDLAHAEQWFVGHGLPYFVDDVRAQVHAGLRRRRLVAVGMVALGLGLALGVGAGWWRRDVGVGVTLGTQLVLVVLVVYAWTTLRAGVIARWAVRRTLKSLGFLFPLVTRALPLLLLFVTFLFINTEVWQVSSRLDGAVMWLTVAMFLTITVGFLLARLPEELDVFDADLDADRVRAGCRGTPLEGWDTVANPAEVGDDHIGGLQKANLVLVLLIAQLVQVLLLSMAMFAFFVAFGLLVMDPDVIRSWTQQPLTAVPFFERANMELLRVSVFLASFSGLYFTVYAVTDELYRKQFFTSIIRELERAVSARAAYRALRRTT